MTARLKIPGIVELELDKAEPSEFLKGAIAILAIGINVKVNNLEYTITSSFVCLMALDYLHTQSKEKGIIP